MMVTVGLQAMVQSGFTSEDKPTARFQALLRLERISDMRGHHGTGDLAIIQVPTSRHILTPPIFLTGGGSVRGITTEEVMVTHSVTLPLNSQFTSRLTSSKSTTQTQNDSGAERGT